MSERAQYPRLAVRTEKSLSDALKRFCRDHVELNTSSVVRLALRAYIPPEYFQSARRTGK